jgi:uncharacterized membrane protein YfcA
MFLFYGLALVIVFFGVIINLPGTLHINALLLHYFEPHKVLLLSTVFLLLGAVSRIVVFWKQIVWREVYWFSVYGVFGGLVGGYFVGSIPDKIIVLIFIISGLTYLYKYISQKKQGKESGFGLFVSGFLSSFLQSFGMSVGVLRQGYLFSRGYTLEQVHGSIAVVFLVSSSGILFSRFMKESFTFSDILPMLYLFPPMILTMYFAKGLMKKIPMRVHKAIILYSLIASIILSVPFLFVSH